MYFLSWYTMCICVHLSFYVSFSCGDYLLITPFLRSLNQWVPGYHRGRPCLKLAKTLLPPLAVPLFSSKKTILTGPGRILPWGGQGMRSWGQGSGVDVALENWCGPPTTNCLKVFDLVDTSPLIEGFQAFHSDSELIANPLSTRQSSEQQAV